MFVIGTTIADFNVLQLDRVGARQDLQCPTFHHYLAALFEVYWSSIRYLLSNLMFLNTHLMWLVNMMTAEWASPDRIVSWISR